VSSGDIGVVELAVSPGGVFVVSGVGPEASVEDADEAVTECAEGLGVGVTFGFALVVEVAAAGAGVERAERPTVDGVA